MSQNAAPSTGSSEASEGDGLSRTQWTRRLLLVAVGLVFFGFLMWEVVNPYRGQRFEEVPHGDHVHYVPKDRNPDVPINRFPTQKPEPNERILPDGQVVSTDDAR